MYPSPERKEKCSVALNIRATVNPILTRTLVSRGILCQTTTEYAPIHALGRHSGLSINDVPANHRGNSAEWWHAGDGPTFHTFIAITASRGDCQTATIMKTTNVCLSFQAVGRDCTETKERHWLCSVLRRKEWLQGHEVAVSTPFVPSWWCGCVDKVVLQRFPYFFCVLLAVCTGPLS